MVTNHRDQAKAAALAGIASVEVATMPLRAVIVDASLSFTVTVSWLSGTKVYASSFTIDDTALATGSDVYRRIQLAAARVASLITSKATMATYLVPGAGATPTAVSTGEVQ